MLIKSVPLRHGFTWHVASMAFLKAHRKTVWATPLLLALLLQIPLVSGVFGIGLYFFLSGIVIGFNQNEQRSLFLSFSQGAWPRLLFIFTLQFGLALIMVNAIGPYLEPMMKAMQGGKTPSPEDMRALMLTLGEPLMPFLPWLILLQAIAFFYVPLASFTKQSGLQILIQSILALFKNGLPFILYGLVLFVLLYLTGIVVSGMVLLIGQLAAFSGLLARFAMTFLELLITGSFFAFFSANMLMAYRDVFEQPAPVSKPESETAELLL